MFFQQIEQNVKVHVDDMLVKSKEEEHYLNGLKETFKALCLYGMKLNPNKCVFVIEKVPWLHGIPTACQSQPR